MSYDREAMAKIAEQLFQVHVERAHGEEGVTRLRSILACVKRVYEVRSPLSFTRALVVVAALGETTPALDHAACSAVSSTMDFAGLPDDAVLEVTADGSVWARSLDGQAYEDFAGTCVVYVYDGATGSGYERIILETGEVSIPNPNGYPSALAIPTFWELEDSLGYYSDKLASRSTCKILKSAWAGDAQKRRLVFVNSPESTMRESLAQHLRSSLRDHGAIRVNEEQNQSETEPVDIEVTWSLTTHIALIEVKWLGKCLNETDSDLASYSHSDARARDGVTQLAGYLDDAYERNPGHEIKGYLVVFDGRRWGVTTWEPGTITSDQAWYFENREIDYQAVIPTRPDFMTPIRFYLEPRGIPRPTSA
ncbi:hypothetical protein [Aeromicrobium sp.]|uniref:hypothetical protein n=1 Tax=Aeromicrobium sp. TaxID=1871063 RepID=UPI0040336F0B